MRHLLHCGILFLTSFFTLCACWGQTTSQYINVADVRRYGARGDGVTDDRLAIQKAITAAATGSGIGRGRVWVPPGTYVFGSTLTWSASWDNVEIVGAANGSTIFQWDHDGAATQGIVIDAPSGEIRDVTFRNITFRGKANSSVDGAYDILNLRRNLYGLRFINCRFMHAIHAAILISATSSLGRDILIEGCIFERNCGGGSDWSGNLPNGGAAIQGQYPGLVIKNCVFRNNGGTNQNFHAIYFDQSITVSGVRVVGCWFAPGDGSATINDVRVSGGTLVTVIYEGNIFEECRKLMIGGQTGFVVTGNIFSGSYLDVTSGTGGTVTGNTFINGYVETSNGNVTNLVVSSNTFRNSGGTNLGINVTSTGCSRWLISGNVILTGNSRAINLAGTQHRVERNSIVGGATSASASQYITILSGSGNVGHHIYNNRIVHAGSGVTSPYLMRDESGASAGSNLAWGNLLVLESGSSVNAGAMVNWDYVVSSGTSATGLVGVLERSATVYWDPPDVADGGFTTTTVTLSGAALGDEAAASFSLALPAGCTISAAVTGADTVTVTLRGNQSLGVGTLRASIKKRSG